MARVATRVGQVGFAEQGGGDGTPLLFLHGVGSDKSAWAADVAAFGCERRTVALDFPGYGESDPASAFGGSAHDGFASAVLAAMDALEIQQAHVCGLSLGGVVAIALASSAPDRIASLILADSFAFHPDGEAILERSLAASGNMRSLAEARVPALLTPDPAPELVTSLIRVFAAIDPVAFRLGSRAVWPADQRDRARAIHLPCLILCGSEDRVTPLALSQELNQLITGSRLEVISGAGHLPNLEQPDAFGALMSRFLTGTETKAKG